MSYNESRPTSFGPPRSFSLDSFFSLSEAGLGERIRSSSEESAFLYRELTGGGEFEEEELRRLLLEGSYLCRERRRLRSLSPLSLLLLLERLAWRRFRRGGVLLRLRLSRFEVDLREGAFLRVSAVVSLLLVSISGSGDPPPLRLLAPFRAGLGDLSIGERDLDFVIERRDLGAGERLIDSDVVLLDLRGRGVGERELSDGV